MPFRKLGRKFHFFLRFCTRKRSKTYIYTNNLNITKMINKICLKFLEFFSIFVATFPVHSKFPHFSLTKCFLSFQSKWEPCMSAGDSEGVGGPRGTEGEGNLSHSPSGWELRGGGGYPRSKFFYFHAVFRLKFCETIIFCPKLRGWLCSRRMRNFGSTTSLVQTVEKVKIVI